MKNFFKKYFLPLILIPVFMASISYAYIYNPTGSTTSGTVTSITASSPLTGGTITSSGSIGCQTASGSQAGCLSSSDWTAFNGKLSSTLTSQHFLTGNGSNVATDSGAGLLYDRTSGNLRIDSSGLSPFPFVVNSSGNTAFGATSSAGQVTFNMVPSGGNGTFLTFLNDLTIGTAGGVGAGVTDMYDFDNAGNFTAGFTGNVQGSLRLVGLTSGVIKLTTDTNAGTYDLVLPTALGGNPAHPWVLVDPLGDGHLSFVNPSVFSPTLIQNQIAYGDSSNSITSSSQLLFDPASRFSVQFTYNSIANSPFIDAQPGSGIVQIGDIAASKNGTSILVDDHPGALGNPSIGNFVNGTYIVADVTNNIPYFNVNTTTQTSFMGDFGNFVNGTALSVDIPNTSIIATAPGIFQVQDAFANPWLQVRPTAGNAAVGDINITSTGLTGIYDALANQYNLYSTYNSISSSLLEQIDAANSVWKWGDLSNAKNGTKLQLNDDDRTLTYSATGGNNPFFKVDLTNNDSITGDFDNTITGFYTNTDWGNQIFTVQNQLDNYLTVNVLGGVYSLGPIATTGAGFKFDVGNGNTDAYVQGPSYGFQVLDSGNSGLPSADFSTVLSQIGDIAGIGTGTVFNVDPIGGVIDAHVSDSFNVFNGTNTKYFEVDTVAKNIISQGTMVESNIGSTTYGGTLNYTAGFAGKSRAYFSGSHSGSATGLLLPTGTNASIGTKFTVDDLGGLATTDPITIDAGSSNTITGPLGTAQTFVLTTSGTSVSIIKLTSTAWMIE